MKTAYRTKLYRSVLDCGCTMGLDEFSEEARVEDVQTWLEERGYVLTRSDDWGKTEAPATNETPSFTNSSRGTHGADTA